RPAYGYDSRMWSRRRSAAQTSGAPLLHRLEHGARLREGLPRRLEAGSPTDAKPSKHTVDIRIATYNIHRCRGMDRRVMPARIIDVLREVDADVIALQEVIGAGPTGAGQAEEIGAGLGMGWVMASVRHLRNHLFGNVVMSRCCVTHHSQYDLSWRTCEPRACQRVDLEISPGRTLHVYNVHLGTAVLERRYQA